MKDLSLDEVPADPEQALVVSRLEQRLVDARSLAPQLFVERLKRVAQSVGRVARAAVVGPDRGRAVPGCEAAKKVKLAFYLPFIEPCYGLGQRALHGHGA